MADSKEQIGVLVERFRKGEIGEESLVEQLGSLNDGAQDDVSAADETVDETAATPDPPDLMAKLDAYRAAEASGAETVAVWADLTDDENLAGGLRVIAAREAAHAELLEKRLGELGGPVDAVIPEWLSKYNAAILNPTASDTDRLGAIVAQFPDPEVAVDHVRAFAVALSDDALTCELLLSICDDELATLNWIHDAYAARRKGRPNARGD